MRISGKRRTKHRQMLWLARTTHTVFLISVRTLGTHIARGTGANGPRLGVKPSVTLGVIFYIRFRLPSVTEVALYRNRPEVNLCYWRYVKIRTNLTCDIQITLTRHFKPKRSKQNKNPRFEVWCWFLLTLVELSLSLPPEEALGKMFLEGEFL